MAETTTLRTSLPPATVQVICDFCGAEIARLPLQEQHFLTNIFAARRAHARRAHGYDRERD